jgi:hypothetical protein
MGRGGRRISNQLPELKSFEPMSVNIGVKGM